MTKSFLKIAVSIAALAFPFTAQAEPPSVLAGPDFQGVKYSMTSSGTAEVYVGARDVGGKIAICGLVILNKVNATSRQVEKKGTEAIGFKLDGQGLYVSTALFIRYDSEAAVRAAKGKAGCSVTHRPWTAAYANSKVEMVFRDGAVRF